jgi:IPT/TIG domain/Cysteine-rich secretory protein family
LAAPEGVWVKFLVHRLFAALLLGGLAIAMLTNFPAGKSPAVHIDARPAASTGWLARFNTWRAGSSVPNVTENTTYSSGDYLHAAYMVQTGQVTHYESTAYPQYTVAGDTAAQNSNIFVSSSTATTDEQAIDWWMGAPFHAMAMMDPRLSTTGFGAYRDPNSPTSWQLGAAVNVSQGNSQALGLYTNPVFFPGNGSTEPLTAYSGNEFPNPQIACPGYNGLPLFIEIGGNVDTVAGAHSLAGNGTPLATCVIDSSNANYSSNLKWRGGAIVMPQAVLQNGVHYVVALTVNNVPHTWSFTVGSFFNISTVTPAAGTAAGGAAITISGSGFTGATSVKFGTAPATSFTVVNDSTITAVSPAHAVGAVDVTVTKAAGTTPLSSADQFTYATPCTAVTAAASPVSPSVPGTQVTITGTGTCPSANPLYEFWMMPAGSTTWQLVQGFSTSASYQWNSTGALPGAESFGVWVRDASSPGISSSSMGSYDAFVSLPYTMSTSSAACTGVTVTPSPASPATPGTSVTLTAAATGCPNARYEFWALWQGASSWQQLTGWSSTATYTWNSTGALNGTERFGAWARDASSAATYDTYSGIAYSIAATACSGITATASPTTATHGTGAHIVITAVAAGCTNPQFEFWMRAGGSSTWQLVQGYSANATYNWNSTGAPAGTEHFGVWVRAGGSSASYESYVSLPFTLS